VDIHLVDSSLPPDSPDSYNNITPRIVKETPGCFFPDQHNNRDNNEAHYRTTGPEIWEQMEGKIDYFVAGMGTGGTIGGVAQYLKEQDQAIRVIAIDPLGSIFYDYFHYKKIIKPKPYTIEGLGDEFLINCADFDNIDDIYQISDRDAFQYTRKLVLEEGILGGGSSGAALWGVLKLAKTLDKPARIVTIFPDSASRYLSTIFNDRWMKENDFL
jgi:cystathionine beta-synthase